MISPSEPKIWFKGSLYLEPCFLEQIVIDYYTEQVQGLIRTRTGAPIRVWFDWGDPNIIMRLSDQEPQYG